MLLPLLLQASLQVKLDGPAYASGEVSAAAGAAGMMQQRLLLCPATSRHMPSCESAALFLPSAWWHMRVAALRC
jgi:hypothetical protein